MFNSKTWALAASASLLPLAMTAEAATLRTGFGGPADYGVLTQGPNDDGSSGSLTLPFTVNFFGNSYSSMFVNNNGNISFGSPTSAFTPIPFGQISGIPPIIAPYWADVDTRCAGGCGAVYAGSTSSNSFTVTWNDVGYFSSHGDKRNNFQMTFLDQGSGDFDIEFLYDYLNWSTGDASSGVNGLGGIPAQAGYDAGNGNFFTLPGSFLSPGVLNLANTTNVTGGDPGEWLLKIRGGALVPFDGTTPNNPLLPSQVTEAGYTFNFVVTTPTQVVWIDPLVATGYDYVATGALITSAMFPTLGDADGYEVYALSGGILGALLGVVADGGTFSFGAGVTGFALRDIETSFMLDPANTTAFVTGLTFAVSGSTSITVLQTPITTFVPDNNGAVPEPGTWAMMLAGFGLMGAALRRRQKVAVRYAM